MVQFCKKKKRQGREVPDTCARVQEKSSIEFEDCAPIAGCTSTFPTAVPARSTLRVKAAARLLLRPSPIAKWRLYAQCTDTRTTPTPSSLFLRVALPMLRRQPITWWRPRAAAAGPFSSDSVLKTAPTSPARRESSRGP